MAILSLSSGINWWKLLVPGTVDEFSNLIVRLLLASSTSSFSIRMNFIPSIADLQYSNIVSVERICLEVGLCRLSFATILFTVPPMPSLVAKKFHFASSPKSFWCLHKLQSSYNSCIVQHNNIVKYFIVKYSLLFTFGKLALITSIISFCTI